MHPPFNQLPIQVQTNGTAALAPQQVRPPDHCQGNSSNLLPSSAQFQPQMGIINPQITNPFNNYNIHLSNGNLAMPNRPIMAPQISIPFSNFMNSPNQQFVMQNGMPPSGPPGAMSHPCQFPSGYGSQNLNSIPMNQINSSQPNGQLFTHNPTNMTPYFNQNVSFQNGQLCLQKPMQNMGQFVQMQMPNYTQVVPSNLSMFQSQGSQGMGPQNATFAANQQFGLVHSNGVVQQGNQGQHRLIQPTMEANGLKQSPNPNIQQLQGNTSLQFASGSVQPQKTHNFNPVFTKPQGNPTKENDVKNLNTNWKNSQNRNFTRHPKSEASRKGFTKFPQNAHGKLRFHNEHGGKGYDNDRARKSSIANSSNQTQVENKRSVPLNYTEQEVQQWREERKKNYPSKANVDKKLTRCEVADRDAKLRRQQLKEILTKQAELGCEVAEIPPYYLSDSEKQVHGKEENKRAYGKKGRFRNKFNKRGRFHQNDRFNKKQGPADHDSSNANDQNAGFTKKQRFANNNSSDRPTMNKREPTLLQKLLSADLRREKAHLLQVFRFMVMNSFFKDWPEKNLRFPEVILKEDGGEGEMVEEKSSSLVKKVVFEGSEKAVIKESKDDSDNDDNGNNDETDAQVKTAVGKFVRQEGSIRVEVVDPEEEEGEIID